LQSAALEHGSIESMTAHPDGRRCLVSGTGKFGRVTYELRLGASPRFRRLEASANHTALPWMAQMGVDPTHYNGRGEYAFSAMQFTPDGRHVVTGAIDGAWLLDAKTMRPIKVLELSGRWLAVTPDGREAIGSWANEICAVSLDGGAQRLVAHPAEEIWKGALSHDGRHLITMSRNGGVEAWPMTKSDGHPRTIWPAGGDDVAISPDGRHVACTSSRSVTYLEVESGVVCGRFHGTGTMSSVAISRDGRTIIVGEDTGRVYILRVAWHPRAS
jgi:WD40 repeat protein